MAGVPRVKYKFFTKHNSTYRKPTISQEHNRLAHAHLQQAIFSLHSAVLPIWQMF